MKFIYIVFVVLIATIYSCDKVDSPYIEKPNSGGGGNSGVEFVQKVLIEDYTAHTCVNCPRAARTLEELHATYENKVIPIAIHVGSLASPYGSPFEADFRTQNGNELDAEFGLSASGLPKGMINRTKYNGDVKVPDGEWGTATSILLNKSPLYGIVLKPEIDKVNHSITVGIDIHVLRDTTQNLTLSVFLTEDSLIGGQLDGEVSGDHIVSKYVFMHLFRTSLNGTWGEEVASTSTPIFAKDIIKKKIENFSYDASWVSEKLNIVAFVYDNDTKRVFQAEMKHIE